MALSRRDFLTRVGQAGGFQATFLVMQGLGMAPASAAPARPGGGIAAAPGSGAGVKVVILGGGIAGLVSAFELRALGYDCTLLEARARPGGRNWTVRGGDTISLLDGTTQQCAWDKEHYQNFGPARLPSIHSTMLGYCRKLGVELQVEVNTTRSEMLQNDAVLGGRPQVLRQVVSDTRGHVSELLAKSIQRGSLDAELSTTDRERMLDFLRTYGSLDDANKYNGCDGAGYSKLPGAGEDAGTLSTPIDMHTLLDAKFWQGVMFEEQFDQQATMFQPVGGMDRIPYAFARSLGPIVRYNAPVTAIAKTSKGVRVSYTEDGAARSLEATYCVCAMPLTMLRNATCDISAPYKKVIAECSYAGAYKAAWESRRFWEQDYNVYGGLEQVVSGLTPVWLPSAGMFSERGVLVSGYGFDDLPGSPFSNLSLEAKLNESRRSVERLHPGHGQELQKPVYVGWQRVEWNRGSWISGYEPATGQALPRRAVDIKSAHSPGYRTLIEPDGPIFFAGDHVSHIVGWQEGAALSAHRAVGQISDRTKAARLAGGTSGEAIA